MKKQIRTLKLHRETIVALDQAWMRGGVGESDGQPICTLKCASGPLHRCFGTMEESCRIC
jgi:hypothetical protein